MRKNRLSFEEECELVTRWKQHGDERARNRLVSSHDWLVKYLVSKYADPDSALGKDLCQEGGLGLMHAADKFNPMKCRRFATYSGHWVKAYVLRMHFRSRRFDDTHRLADKKLSNFSQVEDPSAGPEQACCEESDNLQIRRALAFLERDERFVITQRFFSNKEQTLKEIGTMVNLSPQRICQIETKAKAKLKILLEGINETNSGLAA